MVSTRQTGRPNESPVERRRHPRFKVPEKTLAITSTIVGQIVDISAGGCELKCIGGNGELVQESVMDIMMNDKGFYLEQLTIAMAWHECLQSLALSTITTRKIGVRFVDLSPLQKARIDYFINHYAIGPV